MSTEVEHLQGMKDAIRAIMTEGENDHFTEAIREGVSNAVDELCEDLDMPWMVVQYWLQFGYEQADYYDGLLLRKCLGMEQGLAELKQLYQRFTRWFEIRASRYDEEDDAAEAWYIEHINSALDADILSES